jgi:lipopolysaccharide export system protein LptA
MAVPVLVVELELGLGMRMLALIRRSRVDQPVRMVADPAEMAEQGTQPVIFTGQNQAPAEVELDNQMELQGLAV